VLQLERERIKDNKLYNIAILNCISIILVVLGHSGCVWAGKWNDKVFYNSSSSIKYITLYIYSFHMPLFVFISGYLYSYGKRLDKYKSFKQFIGKKVNRQLIPYLLVGTLFMLPAEMIFHLNNDSSSYFKRVINEIILAKSPSHLWFILMLFNLFIIFYIIEEYLNRNNVALNLLMLFIISVISVIVPNIYQISQSL
jgi:fucose 4-O-acetylase-like acetyltransferase